MRCASIAGTIPDTGVSEGALRRSQEQHQPVFNFDNSLTESMPPSYEVTTVGNGPWSRMRSIGP